MMGLISWIIFGALAGWIASILTGRNSRMGCLANIVIGVVGALLGGWIIQLLTGQPFSMGWNLTAFIVAVISASLLLLITGLFSPGRRR